MKIILTYVISILLSLPSFAQNVVLEYDCVDVNSAILGEVLIQEKGEQFVAKLLEEEQRFLFFVKVDSLGCVKSLRKIKSTNADNKTIKEMSSFITESDICICVCYEWLHQSDKEKLIKEIKENLFFPDCEGLYLNNVAFPGAFMIQYNNREKEELSKLEYFKLQIKRYKSIYNAWN